MMNYSNFRKMGLSVMTTLVLSLWAGVSWATDLTVTNTWTSRDTLNATDLNQNFTDAENAVTDNNARITTNAADIANNAAAISTNATNISNLPLLGADLPKGSTIRGFFGLGWTAAVGGEYHETSISFIYTFASAPTAHFIANGDTPPIGCPGSSTDPQADPGHICFYEDNTANTTSKRVCSSTNCPGATRWGVQFRAFSSGAGSAFTRGTWVATAP